MEEFEFTDAESEEDATGRELAECSSSCSVEVGVLMVGPPSGRLPVIIFNSDIAQSLSGPLTHPFPSPYRVTFKFGAGQAPYKIVITTLLAHGFKEVSPSSSNFNLLWSGTHHPHMFRNLRPYQKVNHFPRCSEITRKDRLVENVRRMQKLKGVKHFNIVPKTFILPEELGHFNSTYRKQRGTWIIKPTSLSRGRGISLINHPNQLPRNEAVVVSKYIQNPLCVDGYKFDLRLYVAVTSYNPLKIYLYEEGLTRFATVQYAGANEQLDNRCMHLTNYSVNKTNEGFVRCEDPSLEDYGNKWSMSALLRQLQDDGINVTELMMRVEDVIIKTIICGEAPIVAGSKVLQIHKGNCFELFGFDILIDEHLQPWILEVNLSPSVACDAPLDLRIKSNLIADLLSLAGITLQDPYQYNAEGYGELRTGQHHHRTKRSSGGVSSTSSLSVEEVAIVRETKEEYARRGGFIRLMPSEDSWELYGSFLEDKDNLNFMLHQQLYPERVKSACPKPSALSSIIAKRLCDISDGEEVLDVHLHDHPTGLDPRQRTVLYTRRLFRHMISKPSPSSTFTVEYNVPSSLKQNGLTVSQQVSSVSKSSTDICTSTSDHMTTLLDHVIKNVEKMSKFQAREVFASYLEHVQKRLVKETRLPDSTQASTLSEQQNAVDVVVTFLKKAASNLKTSFTVVEPKTSLSLREQRRLLARQLADFILLYRKETVEQSNRDRGMSDGDGKILSTKVLQAFLSQASENDLEKVLGVYAKQSRSSTVFLGSGDADSENTSFVDHSHSRSGTNLDHSTASQSMIYDDNNPRSISMNDVSMNSGVTAVKSMGEASSETGDILESHREEERSKPPPGIIWVNDSDYRGPAQSYQGNMFTSGGLSVGQRESLDSLTKSLAGFKMADKQSRQTSSHRRHSSQYSANLSSVQGNSLSVQSLASTSTRSMGAKSSCIQNGSSNVSLGGKSPSKSSSPVIISKTKPYISPYAQSVVRPKSLRKNRTRKKIQAPLHPASSEESITQALQRLSHRHSSAHKLTNEADTSTVPRKRPPLVPKTEIVKSIATNPKVLSSNGNNSNNRPPSMGLTLKRRHSLDASYMRGEGCSPSGNGHQSNISDRLQMQNSTSVATSKGHRSSRSRKSRAISYSALGCYGNSTPKNSRPLYFGQQEMSSSEELLLRIQEHNQAISQYIQMHRYHSSTPPSSQPHPPGTFSSGTPSSHFMTPSHLYCPPHTGTL